MLKTLLEQLRCAKAFLRAGSRTKRYIRHQAGRWKKARHGRGVVLTSMCATPSVIHCYAELLPRFANQLNASIETFLFQQTSPDPLVSAIYRSFGAALGLQVSQERSLREKAETRAEEIYSQLGSKQDVIQIQENGIWLGDLIYDSYLRDLLLATVDIKDPQLFGYIRDALLYLYSSERYLESHQVKAVFADHLVYIWQGVLPRVAKKKHIPIYVVSFYPWCGVQRVDLISREDGRDVPTQFSYWRYPEIFLRMPESKQAEARQTGRAYLEHRLSGGLQNDILNGQSAYAPSAEQRILGSSPAPKILILLHDFYDAVHSYRSSLFDDFYEWIHFLLEEASKTPFEWYVKPHPNLNEYRRRGIENSNQMVVEELKQAYPNIRFLEPSVSNRQLCDEGLSGVFTMHGTAAHEFPFLGVPAVCGADNPQVSYPFARTPKTVEEYVGMIRAAAFLGEVEGKDRIPEFCYMNYFYAVEHLGAATKIFDPMPGWDQGYDEEVWEAAMKAASPEADRILDQYVLDLLEGNTPSCVM